MKPLLLVCALAAVAVPFWAYGAAGVAVVQPWSRPAVAGTNGVGYMVLVNHGPPDILEKVESPIAARIEIHSSSMSGGVMSMKKVDRVMLPSGGQTTFGPGGFHMMLIGLTQTLKPGDRAPATLSFASGRKVAVAFVVSDGVGPPPMVGMAH